MSAPPRFSATSSLRSSYPFPVFPATAEEQDNYIFEFIKRATSSNDFTKADKSTVPPPSRCVDEEELQVSASESNNSFFEAEYMNFRSGSDEDQSPVDNKHVASTDEGDDRDDESHEENINSKTSFNQFLRALQNSRQGNFYFETENSTDEESSCERERPRANNISDHDITSQRVENIFGRIATLLFNQPSALSLDGQTVELHKDVSQNEAVTRAFCFEDTDTSADTSNVEEERLPANLKLLENSYHRILQLEECISALKDERKIEPILPLEQRIKNLVAERDVLMQRERKIRNGQFFAVATAQSRSEAPSCNTEESSNDLLPILSAKEQQFKEQLNTLESQCSAAKDLFDVVSNLLNSLMGRRTLLQDKINEARDTLEGFQKKRDEIVALEQANNQSYIGVNERAGKLCIEGATVAQLLAKVEEKKKEMSDIEKRVGDLTSFLTARENQLNTKKKYLEVAEEEMKKREICIKLVQEAYGNALKKDN